MQQYDKKLMPAKRERRQQAEEYKQLSVTTTDKAESEAAPTSTHYVGIPPSPSSYLMYQSMLDAQDRTAVRCLAIVVDLLLLVPLSVLSGHLWERQSPYYPDVGFTTDGVAVRVLALCGILHLGLLLVLLAVRMVLTVGTKPDQRKSRVYLQFGCWLLITYLVLHLLYWTAVGIGLAYYHLFLPQSNIDIYVGGFLMGLFLSAVVAVGASIAVAVAKCVERISTLCQAHI